MNLTSVEKDSKRKKGQILKSKLETSNVWKILRNWKAQLGKFKHMKQSLFDFG